MVTVPVPGNRYIKTKILSKIFCGRYQYRTVPYRTLPTYSIKVVLVGVKQVGNGIGRKVFKVTLPSSDLETMIASSSTESRGLRPRVADVLLSRSKIVVFGTPKCFSASP